MESCERNHKYRIPQVLFDGCGTRPVAAVAGILLLGSLTWFSSPSLLLAQTESDLSVPAEYIRDLTLPGSQNHFLRPERILIEPRNGEIYVADPGNSRIVILDRQGVYLYEFSTSEQCGAPSDVAVDSAGYIYVLGSTTSGLKIFVYDYDGLYLRQLAIGSDSSASPPEPGSIAIDSRDRLYLLDQNSLRIIRVRHDGSVEREFAVAADIDSTHRAELACGSLTIAGDLIYLPVASLGVVYRYDLEGDLQGMIGHSGTGIGELTFPVAVAVTGHDLIMVLDKHRYNVVCFSASGKFLGEFGGKGVSPGWFFHPTWLAVDNRDQVYIGQIFNNKIQVCRIPEFIRARLSQLTDHSLPTSAGDHELSSNNSNKSQDMNLMGNNFNLHHGG